MECLILSIFGDLSNFMNGIKKSGRVRYTKKKYGDMFEERAMHDSLTLYFLFIFEGGVNRNYNNNYYSYVSLIIIATIKGLLQKENLVNNCKKEYIKLYNKYGEKELLNKYWINNVNLSSLSNLKNNVKNTFNLDKYNDARSFCR